MYLDIAHVQIVKRSKSEYIVDRMYKYNMPRCKSIGVSDDTLKPEKHTTFQIIKGYDSPIVVTDIDLNDDKRNKTDQTIISPIDYALKKFVDKTKPDESDGVYRIKFEKTSNVDEVESPKAEVSDWHSGVDQVPVNILDWIDYESVCVKYRNVTTASWIYSNGELENHVELEGHLTFGVFYRLDPHTISYAKKYNKMPPNEPTYFITPAIQFYDWYEEIPIYSKQAGVSADFIKSGYGDFNMDVYRTTKDKNNRYMYIITLARQKLPKQPVLVFTIIVEHTDTNTRIKIQSQKFGSRISGASCPRIYELAVTPAEFSMSLDSSECIKNKSE
jgi:hypothetical protein